MPFAFNRLSLGTVLGLLALTVLFRWPVFHPNYVATDEALYLTIADRLVRGMHLYAEAWEHKPPLTPWFFQGVVWIFGSGADLAVKVFTVIYVWLLGLSIAALFLHYKPNARRGWLPGMVYIVLVSAPWYALELNSELLMTGPALLALGLFLYYFVDDKKHWLTPAWIGVWCAVCMAFKFQGFFYVAIFGITYLMIAPFRLADVWLFGVGFGVATLTWLMRLYLLGTLDDFWDLGFVYNLDYIGARPMPGQDFSWRGIFNYLFTWGGFIVLTSLGFLGLRARSYGLSIRERKLEILMTWWLILGGIQILLGGSRFYLHYFWFVAPAVAFYVYEALNGFKQVWVYRTMLVVSLAVPVGLWSTYWYAAYDLPYQRLSRYTRPNGWLAGLRQGLQGHPQWLALRADLQNLPPETTVLIADYQPELYRWLGRFCGSKYTDFSMAYFKMDWAEHNRLALGLLSESESLARVYQTFEAEKPDYIIDPLGLFAEMKSRIPLLLADYHPRTVNQWVVYERKKQ